MTPTALPIGNDINQQESDTLATPTATVTPPNPAPIPDRSNLTIETARQPGGVLDPDSWIAPTPERLAPFLAQEPDQSRIDQLAYEWLLDGSKMKAEGTGGGIDEEFKKGLQTYVD